MRQEDLPADARTLDPLSLVLRHGLVAVSFFGFLSFAASATLFCYLTYRLISWRIKGQARDGYNQFVLLIYMLVIADIHQSLAFLLPTRWLAENKIHVGTSTCWAEVSVTEPCTSPRSYSPRGWTILCSYTDMTPSPGLVRFHW